MISEIFTMYSIKKQTTTTLPYLLIMMSMIGYALNIWQTAQANALTTSPYLTPPSPQATHSQPSMLAALVPPSPKLKASGYVLIDADSGHILAAKQPDQRLTPASLTKMMTLYIVSQALKAQQIRLDDKVPVSEKAWHMGGSRMFVKPHSYVRVSDLIQGIIVDSGNDACVAMAEYIAGSEDAFAHLMNQIAAKLNMTHSHFSSSTGLPNKNHYSTPGDLAILAKALLNDFPEYYHWYKEKWFTYNKIKQPNRNRLLWRDASVDGIKTGHTDKAGFCLVSSAKRKGQRLISVVMGCPTDAARFSESQRLLNYGFRFFTTKPLYLAHTPIVKPTVWFGKQTKTSLGLAQTAYVTLPKSSADNKQLSVKPVLNKRLQAPIQQGNVYGHIEVYLNKKQIATYPLIALEDNPAGNLLSRLTDHVNLFFHSLFSTHGTSSLNTSKTTV